MRLPNPHRSDVGRELLSRILKQAGIDRDSWEKVWAGLGTARSEISRLRFGKRLRNPGDPSLHPE